jgi:hypothetical protein
VLQVTTSSGDTVEGTCFAVKNVDEVRIDTLKGDLGTALLSPPIQAHWGGTL